MPTLGPFDRKRILLDIEQVQEMITRTEYLVQEEQDAERKEQLQDQLVDLRQQLATSKALLT